MSIKNHTEGDRSRVDGALHRSLPATLSIRSADSDQSADGLLRLQLSVSSEAPYLRTSWWDDPWVEVLGHKAGEIDLSRLNDGAPVLANHDRWTAIGNTPLAGIGTVEKAWIDGSRLLADLVISRREALADFRQDIADGLVRNVSIGYIINERVLTKTHSDGSPDEYRVTSWTPFEISPVDIPADATVGLGRSTNEENSRATNYRVISLPAVAKLTGARSMDENEEVIPAGNTPAVQQMRSGNIIGTASGADLLVVELSRVKDLLALGRQFDATDLAAAAIDDGVKVDMFRAQLLDGMKSSGKLRPAESAEIGLTEREIKNFSFCRALAAAADPLHAHNIAPFEMACARAVQDKRGDSRDRTREAALTIPVEVLSRGINLSESAARSAERMINTKGSYRDLTVGSATSAGNLVATELLGSSFIELLRHAMVLDRLGITWLRDLNGNVAIPGQSGTAATYWLPENGAITESNQTTLQVMLTPKTVGAMTDYSRQLLLQSSIDVEAFVRADLAAAVGQAIQLAAFAGSGSNNEPTGLLNTSGIGAVAGGTNGAAPTYDNLVDLESAVAVANADIGNMGYVTNARVRGKLRKTQVFASTNGDPVWTSGAERGIGEVLGYSAVVTNSVPSTLTKGSASAVCSAIMFGNWSDLIIGMWGGLDIMLDPYTNSASGGKRVVALQDVDIAARHVASFAAMKDALTA